MRVIIAGSRDITELEIIEKAVEKSGFEIDVIICGTARGVDLLGRKYGKNNDIPVENYPANWDKYGKRAGYLRNELMADKADALIAIWDGKSKGTKHMIDIATRKDLHVYIFIY